MKLNTNESPYPPSPRTRAAVSDAELARLNLYPDPTGTRLREALAARYGVKPANVLLANGSDEILSFAFMAFCDAETPVAFPDISYGFYPVYAALYGLAAEEIPLRADFSMDVDAFCASRGMRVLANPNAPTGMVLPLSEIERILRAIRTAWCLWMKPMWISARKRRFPCLQSMRISSSYAHTPNPAPWQARASASRLGAKRLSATLRRSAFPQTLTT